MSASTPTAIELRVVSLPAAIEQVEEHLQLELGHGSGAAGRSTRRARRRTACRRRASPLLVDQPACRTRTSRPPPRRRLLARLAEIAVVVVERRVGPAEAAGGDRPAARRAAGDRLQRQLGGDVDQEVARPADGRVDDGRGALAQLVLQRAQRARRHGRRHEPADPLVARVVHHVEEHAGREPAGQVLDERAAAVAAAAACPRRTCRVGRRRRRCRRSRAAPRSPRRPACAASAGGTRPALAPQPA